MTSFIKRKLLAHEVKIPEVNRVSNVLDLVALVGYGKLSFSPSLYSAFAGFAS